MFKNKLNVQRDILNFKEDVLTAFNFIIQDYGFRLIKAEPTLVRFESKNVFVNIYHERLSYELGFEIGLLDSFRKFNLAEILKLNGVLKETGFTFYQASTRERVKKYVAELAILVKKYTHSALNGDQNVFSQLEELQKRTSAKFQYEMDLENTRKNAGKAWKEKNYQLLINIYESIKEDLTPTELKKLDYAKKHLKN